MKSCPRCGRRSKTCSEQGYTWWQRRLADHLGLYRYSCHYCMTNFYRFRSPQREFEGRRRRTKRTLQPGVPADESPALAALVSEIREAERSLAEETERKGDGERNMGLTGTGE